ncbi:MAG: repeat-containing protein [Paenibacillaceae bacterium]|jgi:tetratricopeptide (TPR) repeat protein|nr:repeat-containing protein [Paenibacillaceae bacterium]
MDGSEAIKKAYEAILCSDFEQAIEWFEAAIALEPENAAYHYKLSITCARSNRLAMALQCASKAVMLAPEEQSYRFHYGHLQAKEMMAQAEGLLDQGYNQFYLAAALLREAVKLDPLSVEGRLLLGFVCGELEEYGEAIIHLKEASRLNPQHEGVKKLLNEYGRKIRQMIGGGAEPG